MTTRPFRRGAECTAWSLPGLGRRTACRKTGSMARTSRGCYSVRRPTLLGLDRGVLATRLSSCGTEACTAVCR